MTRTEEEYGGFEKAGWLPMQLPAQNLSGIWIGGGSLIAHNAVSATLNYGLQPGQQYDLQAACIVIGKNVWLRASVTVLQGVTIGDNVVIGAGLW